MFIKYTYKMQIAITTTLSESLLKEIDLYTKQTGKKKNQVIEESLSQFLLIEKRNRLTISFKKAAIDNEIVNMAEEGLTDYKKQFKKIKI